MREYVVDLRRELLFPGVCLPSTATYQVFPVFITHGLDPIQMCAVIFDHTATPTSLPAVTLRMPIDILVCVVADKPGWASFIGNAVTEEGSYYSAVAIATVKRRAAWDECDPIIIEGNQFKIAVDLSYTKDTWRARAWAAA
jgi:hypothetical protein